MNSPNSKWRGDFAQAAATTETGEPDSILLHIRGIIHFKLTAMKKFPLFILAAMVVCGCEQNTIDNDLPVNKDGVVTYTATLGNTTKTELEGLVSNWSIDDQLSLVCLNSLDNTYSFESLELSEGDGTTTGTFYGEIAATKSPVLSFYPAFSGGTITPYTENSTNYIKVSGQNLSPEQYQKGEYADIGKYDKRVATGANASSLVFSPYMTVLKFTVDATNITEIAGEYLFSLSFTDANGKKLAGDYTYDQKDGVEFGSESSQTVNTEYITPQALITNPSVWMVINPDVAINDSLYIVMYTNDFDQSQAGHLVSIGVKASKAYQRGYLYDMPLNLSSLSSKTTILDIVPFAKQTRYGVYNTDYVQPVALATYRQYIDQYAIKSNSSTYTFRIQCRAENSRFYSISLPDKILQVGSTYPATITASNTPKVPQGTVDVKVVNYNSETGMMWLLDETNNIGYIICK